MARLSQATLRAIGKYDQQVDSLARQRYGISGAALLAKLVAGESNDNMGAVSSAQAKGIAQFIPGTRAAVLKKTGGRVDPWRSRGEAIRAAVMHLTGELGNAKGLEGYNPGSSSYPSYILGQKVGDVRKQIAQAGGGQDAPSGGGGGVSSKGGTKTTTTVTGAGFDPGQAGMSALAQLAQQQSRPQPPVTVPSPPQFAASAAMPNGYQAPSAPPVQQEGSNLTDLLSQVTGSGQSVPQVDVKTETTRTDGGGGSSGGGSRGSASVDGDRNPIRGRRGKLIGVPHSGTHTLGNWQSDNAIDLGVPEGTVLESVANGKVVKVKGGYSGGRSRFDGYQVTIQGEDGRQYFYTHLSKTHLKPGQRIRAGQAVGRSGSANGVPHLHLGVSKGDARRYR